MKILKNDKGMSLIEIMIAAAVSIVVAMGVMKINESSQKGFRAIELKSEIGALQNRIQGILMSQDKCSSSGPANAGFRYLNDQTHGNWAGLSSDGLTPPMATHAGYINYTAIPGLRLVTGPGADGDYGTKGSPQEGDNNFIELSNGQPMPGTPNWIMNGAARFYPYNEPDNDDTPNVCFLMIPVIKTGASQSGSVGSNSKNLWFELSCNIDFTTTDQLTTCSSSAQVAQGLFQDNGNGSWGTGEDLHMTGNILIGGVYDAAETAQLRVVGSQPWDADPDPDPAGVFQAIELPTNHAITFGDTDSVGLYHVGGEELVTNKDFNALRHIGAGGNMDAAGSITAGTTIGGTDLNITSNGTVIGNLSSGPLSVNGDASVSTNLSVAGDTTSNTLTTTGNATIGGNGAVTGNLTVTGNINGLGATIRGNTFSFAAGGQFDIQAGRINASVPLIAPIYAFTAGGGFTRNGVEIHSSHRFYANYIRAITMEAANYTYTPSDERYKKNIETIDNATERLSELNPVT